MKNIDVRIYPIHKIFLIFATVVFISASLATSRSLAFATFNGTYIKIVIMFYAISWLAITKKELNLTILSIKIAGILVATVTILNKLNGIGLVEGTRVTIGRSIGSVLGDPNDLSLVLLFPFSFIVATITDPDANFAVKALHCLLGVFILVAVLYTQSRGGLLGICAVIGVNLYQRIENKSLVVAIMLVGASALYVVAGISGRSSGGAHEEGIDESAAGRLYAWQAAYRMATVHPLFGVGLSNFYSNYYLYSDLWDGHNHAVHSTWFKVMAETGFLGFIIFMILFIKTVRLLLYDQAMLEKICILAPEEKSMMQVVNGLLAGLGSFAVSGTFLTQAFTWPLYILVALALGLHTYLEEKAKEHQLHKVGQNALLHGKVKAKA